MRKTAILLLAGLMISGTASQVQAAGTGEGAGYGYEEILDRYKEGSERHSAQEGYQEEFSALVNQNFDQLGYCFTDLNGDGIQELLLGSVNQEGDSCGTFYDLYAFSEGMAVQAASGVERQMYYLCGDGMVRQHNMGGAYLSYDLFFQFISPHLSIVDTVIYDAFTDGENPYFYSAGYPEENSHTPISEETAKELIGRYPPQKIDYIPIAQWGGNGQAGTAATGQVSLDASDYFRDYSRLVNLLGMDAAQSWQFGGGNSFSYEKEGFSLEWLEDGVSKPIFSMKNTGVNQVSLYGVYVGDSALDLDEKLLENGWVSDFKSEDCWYYCSLQEGDTFYQEVRIGDNEQVESWYLCNWPQGEGFSAIYDQLRAGTWTEPMGAAAVIPDATLRSYILERYDGNQDGYLSLEERNNVTEIIVDDYQNITSVRGIEYFPNLEKLMCDRNKIRTMDVSFNPKLSILTFNGNQVSQINLSNNLNLTELYCSDNRLTQLDVSHNPELVALVCDHNQLTELNTQNNVNLKILEHGHNNF